MGCNYYAKETTCIHCGSSRHIHLGKSSAGWKFLFQYNGGKYYKNVREIQEFLERADVEIYDEYQDFVPLNSFWLMVEEKQSQKDHLNEGDFHKSGYYFYDGEFS